MIPRIQQELPYHHESLKIITTLKVINQARKSEYTMEALNCTNHFSSVDDPKKSLSEALGNQIRNIGYIEPAHGLKCRQHWLVRDKDLDDMYSTVSTHKKHRDITLWCFRPTRGNTEAAFSQQSRIRCYSGGLEDTPTKPKSKCAQDVEELIRQLKEKHGKAYTTEQLSCWLI